MSFYMRMVSLIGLIHCFSLFLILLLFFKASSFKVERTNMQMNEQRNGYV
ncbi:hypothetical protein [Vibrio gallaecicus]|nr:hypothetical protein [Vibrio gallaecicus]MDN3616184.1 hypothetical protein [Vibrio gallaecicus]